MPKKKSFRSGFTLIEIMVAVVIVSIVIAALLEMQGNTNHKFLQIRKMMQSNQYNSFLLSQADKYGFENDKLDMERLIEDFRVESDLRRRLSAIKAEIEYVELDTIDTSEFEDGGTDENGEDLPEEDVQTSTTGLVFEIGKTVLKSKEFDGQLIRVRVQ